MRVCSTPGCGTLIPQTGRCKQHRAEADRARGSRQQRGYDTAHDRLRTEWEPRVATGTVKCWRCHQLIPAGTPWDLGHDDYNRHRYKGPEHVVCNRGTNGREPNQNDPPAPF